MSIRNMQFAWNKPSAQNDPDVEQELLHVRALEADEAVSTLFDVRCIVFRDFPLIDAYQAPQNASASTVPDPDIESLMLSPCAIVEDDTPLYYGLLADVERIDSGDPDSPGAYYLLRLRPRIWLLTLGSCSRVFAGVNDTFLAVLRSVLASYGLTEAQPRSVGDYRISVTTELPKIDHAVQYEESDWSFLSRWLERLGLFYWFEMDTVNNVDRLVVSDAPPGIDATTLQLSYAGRNNLHHHHTTTIADWNRLHRRTPARVELIDYDPVTAVGLDAVAEADAMDHAGGYRVGNFGRFGRVASAREHYTNVAPSPPANNAAPPSTTAVTQFNAFGSYLAALRAERYLCERRTYSGAIANSALRAGQAFKLVDAYDSMDDQAYFITSLRATYGAPVTPDAAFLETMTDQQPYRATLHAVPQAVPFRPARVTPWPQIPGVVRGYIAVGVGGASSFASLDATGGYGVNLPFLSSGAQGATTTIPGVRLAQLYSGPGYGTHYPLHQGAEVLVAFVGGDPDQPVIVGAVPDNQTPSPVTQANETQAILKTASGVKIVIDDNPS